MDAAPPMGPISNLNLSVRARNVLAAEGLTSIEQVRAFGYAGLFRLRNAGRQVAGEIWLAVGGAPGSVSDALEQGRASGLMEAADFIDDAANLLHEADARAPWGHQVARLLRRKARHTING